MIKQLLFGLAALLLGPASMSQDIEAGRSKAQSCAVCHGVSGLSAQADVPNLAGQPSLYLATQLRAYRSGARKHEVMSLMAKPLTDDEIVNLSAWFAAIKIEAQPPVK